MSAASPSSAATTIPVDYFDVPSSKGFPGTPKDNPTVVNYAEGIYVGYRYFEKYNIPVSYPFGYGLSYTNFSYSNLKLSSAEFKGKLVVTADITNTGKIAGREVVQLYIGAPVAQLSKPVKELKGYIKTTLLQPGEKQTVRFEIGDRGLASFNESKSAWIAEKGRYEIRIGSSSKNSKLNSSFTNLKELVVKKVNNVLSPKQQITELQ